MTNASCWTFIGLRQHKACSDRLDLVAVVILQ